MAITVNMPNGSTMEFPDGTSYDDIRATLSGRPDTPAPGKADTSDKIGWVDAIGQGIMNLPKSAYDNGKAMVDAVVNYEDTGKALAGLGKGLALKGYRYLTGNGDGAKYPEEVYPDAFGKYIADRYGSADGWKNTIAKDPFGVMTDLSTFFTGGAGAAKGLATGVAKAGKVGADLSKGLRAAGNVATKAAEFTDPLTLAGKGLNLGVNAAYGREMSPAQKMYQSALGLNTGLSNNSKARFSPQEVLAMTDEGVKTRTPVTTSGWKQTNDRIRGINGQIDSAIDALDQTGIQVNPSAIAADAMQSGNRRALAAANSPGPDLDAFDNAVADYMVHHGTDTKYRQAQESKKATYDKHESSYRNNAKPVEKGHTEAEKALASAQRKAIAEGVDYAIGKGLIPDTLGGVPLHELNAKEGANIALRDAIERATLKGGNKGLVDWMITGLGSVLTQDISKGLALGAGKQMLTSPGMRSRMAFGLDNLDKYGTAFRGQRPALAFANADAQVPAITQWYMDPRDGYGNDPRVKGLLDLLARKESVKK